MTPAVQIATRAGEVGELVEGHRGQGARYLLLVEAHHLREDGVSCGRDRRAGTCGQQSAGSSARWGGRGSGAGRGIRASGPGWGRGERSGGTTGGINIVLGQIRLGPVRIGRGRSTLIWSSRVGFRHIWLGPTWRSPIRCPGIRLRGLRRMGLFGNWRIGQVRDLLDGVDVPGVPSGVRVAEPAAAQIATRREFAQARSSGLLAVDAMAHQVTDANLPVVGLAQEIGQDATRTPGQLCVLNGAVVDLNERVLSVFRGAVDCAGHGVPRGDRADLGSCGLTAPITVCDAKEAMSDSQRWALGTGGGLSSHPTSRTTHDSSPIARNRTFVLIVASDRCLSSG